MGKHSKQKLRHSNRKKILATGIVTIGLLASQTSAYAAVDKPRTESVQTESMQKVVEKSGILESEKLNTAALIVAPVTASKDATVSFEKPQVISTPNPERIAEENRVKAQESAKVEAEKQAVVAAEAAKVAKATQVEATKVAQTQAAQVTAARATGAGSGTGAGTGGSGSVGTATSKSAAILAAAKAQLGVQQDCTMLVTNSLKAVGINFHDWPAGYLTLGTITTTPVPGDIAVYKNGGMGMAHVAIVSDTPGMAVHGGWNGHTTAMGPLNLGSGPIFVHIN